MSEFVFLLLVGICIGFIYIVHKYFSKSEFYLLGIIYTIISLFSIYNIIINYNNIIEDIRTTLGIDKLSFEIDVNVISNNLFKGFLSYGK